MKMHVTVVVVQSLYHWAISAPSFISFLAITTGEHLSIYGLLTTNKHTQYANLTFYPLNTPMFEKTWFAHAPYCIIYEFQVIHVCVRSCSVNLASRTIIIPLWLLISLLSLSLLCFTLTHPCVFLDIAKSSDRPLLIADISVWRHSITGVCPWQRKTVWQMHFFKIVICYIGG